MKVFDKLYVAVKAERGAESTMLGFATPYETNAAGQKRQRTVDDWGGKDATNTIMDNIPRAGFQIVDNIKRRYWGGGNVVFRVKDPAGFELEIQSQNLMMLIREVGISSGGVIEGKCIWGRDGSSNILLHESSDEFKHALKLRQGDTKATLNTKDLQVGDAYVTSAGKVIYFLGKLYFTWVQRMYSKDGRVFVGGKLKTEHRFIFAPQGYKIVDTAKTIKVARRADLDSLTPKEVDELIASAYTSQFCNIPCVLNRDIVYVGESAPENPRFEIADTLWHGSKLDFNWYENTKTVPVYIDDNGNPRVISNRHDFTWATKYDRTELHSVSVNGDTYTIGESKCVAPNDIYNTPQARQRMLTAKVGK